MKLMIIGAMSSKADYLKKYLSGGDGTGADGGKVKKVKKVKKDAGGLKIVDNDFDWRTHRSRAHEEDEGRVPCGFEFCLLNSCMRSSHTRIRDSDLVLSCLTPAPWSAPTTEVDASAHIVPDSPPSLRPRISYEGGGGWSTTPAVAAPVSSSTADNSPPRRRGGGGRHDSPDNSPPRRSGGGRHDSPDNSPPRRSGVRHDSPDDSLPRRSGVRHDSPDNSPPRRVGGTRHDLPDNSPPRRSSAARHDSPDNSPPRRSSAARHDCPDNSPPRRTLTSSVTDASPPRHPRSESPPTGAVSRRSRWGSSSSDAVPASTAATTAPATAAAFKSMTGLRDPKIFLAEAKAKAEAQKARLAAMDDASAGRGAVTIVRDARGASGCWHGVGILFSTRVYAYRCVSR
jgi:hypothetical protein